MSDQDRSAPQVARVGEPGKPVRALAFSGGLFDSAMQLGVTHALLVARSVAPDVVVGVSNGAINAAALADILQAGNGTDSVGPQVDRFRHVLEEYLKGPSELLTAVLPDMYLTDLPSPLVQMPLALDIPAERALRDSWIRSRAGILRLINDVLTIDVTIASVTQLIRAALNVPHARERRRWYRRLTMRVVAGVRIWRVLARNAIPLSTIALRIGWKFVFVRKPGPRTERSAIAWLIKRLTAGPQEAGYWSEIWRKILTVVSGRNRSGQPAIELIFRSRVLTFARSSINAVAGAVLTVTALSGGFAVTVLVTAWRLAHHHSWWASVSWGLAFGPGLCVAVAYVIGRRTRGDVWGRFLRAYDLEDALFDAHPIRTWLLRVLDPQYFEQQQSLARVVEVALSDEWRPAVGERAALKVSPTAKQLRAYAEATPSIRVVPVAASLTKGEVVPIRAETPVVDALLAAVARPVVSNPHTILNEPFIDGSGITNDASRAVVQYLRDNVDEHVSAIYVYPVTPLPISQPSLNTRETFAELIPVIRRSVLLERLRDATLQRDLTRLLDTALEDGPVVWWPERPENAPPTTRVNDRSTVLLRVELEPIEPSEFVDVSERVLIGVNPEERRRAISESVADGCRATLETILSQSTNAVADEEASRGAAAKPSSVPCRAVVETHLRGSNRPTDLPGSDIGLAAPGVPEVCTHCCLSRTTSARSVMHRRSADPQPGTPGVANVPTRRHLAVGSRSVPDWPHRFGPQVAVAPSRKAPETSQPSPAGGPLVSVLFSGGVFRGVFLIGVLNAISELNLGPKLIGGSSVGSITAAAAARLFADNPPSGGPNALKFRQRELRRLAATFLSIDHLIVTGRLASFLAEVTLRAGTTHVSPRQFERLFRSYDRTSSLGFQQDARSVLAALERLLYVSPFSLTELVRAFRARNYDEVFGIGENLVQQWLDRSGVGTEILGSEPLELLINEHVLHHTDPRRGEKSFHERLKNAGIEFFATATNLTRGQLEVFSTDEAAPNFAPRVLPLLLASSAFPGLFRPRWRWEVSPRDDSADALIDGGVMDNLPLDAIAARLDQLGAERRIPRRPVVNDVAIPHLMLTASLEPVRRHKLSSNDAMWLASRWRETRRRAIELSYNYKIDSYALVQNRLRTVYNQRRDHVSREPVDIEVVAVKPKWLCSTFAFHPMMGFKRNEHAKSIAHGCRSTFEAFVHLSERRQPTPVKTWMHEWGVSSEAISEWRSTPDSGVQPGRCWYRPESNCPFSETNADHANNDETVKLLDRVYRFCREPKTHEAVETRGRRS